VIHTVNMQHYALCRPLSRPLVLGKGSTWREEFVDTYGERVQREAITGV
jgi:hypothetical protein